MDRLSQVIPISSTDVSKTGGARRQALALAGAMGFDELRQGQLGIIVTEAARNIEAHAGEGEIVLCPWEHNQTAGIDVLALDKGKGIENIAVSLQDGYSTGDTPGNGLGAMSRLADLFQIYSSPGNGTAIFARVLQGANPSQDGQSAYDMGSIRVPIHGEQVCGDDWDVHRTPGRSIYLMADGLGHGPLAAEASREAVRVFRLFAQHGAERILNEVHSALTKTRGAAVSVAEILPDKQVLNYAGAGNIVAAIMLGGKTRSLVSMNGTVGHSMGRVQQFSYPWERESTLIMHSDGLATRWNIEQYKGLASRHPTLLAGILFRDFSRKRDDATIIVTRI